MHVGLRQGLFAAVLATLWLSACLLDSTGGGPKANQAAGGSAGQGGTGGGACVAPEDCPGVNSTCNRNTCTDGVCGNAVAPRETPCSEEGGKLCNGSGVCVRSTGQPCAEPMSCLSGYCIDDVCCELDCTGDCRRCSGSGACVPHAAGTNPESSCGGSCDGTGECATGDHLFSQGWGASGDVVVRDVTITANDDIVVAGYFQGSVDFGDGLKTANQNDVFVLQISSTGTLMWVKHFAGPGNDFARSVAVAANGDVLLCGHFTQTLDIDGNTLTAQGALLDVFLTRLDSMGNHVWNRRFGDTLQQRCADLAVDAVGGVVFAGTFDGTINLGGSNLTSAGTNDIYVAKLDNGGTHAWSIATGDIGEQNVGGVAVDSLGNTWVAGDFARTVNFGGGVLDAGLIASDLYLAKLDTNGNQLFASRYGDANASEVGEELAIDADGNVLFAGEFAGGVNFGGGLRTTTGQDDGFLVSLDQNGGYRWDKQFTGSSDANGTAVAVDASGQIAVVGEFVTNVDVGLGPMQGFGANDVFVAKYTSDGTPLWSKVFGDNASQFAEAVVVDGNDQIIYGGYGSGTVDFGGGPISNGGVLVVFAP
jgi:hypothetical protein